MLCESACVCGGNGEWRGGGREGWDEEITEAAVVSDSLLGWSLPENDSRRRSLSSINFNLYRRRSRSFRVCSTSAENEFDEEERAILKLSLIPGGWLADSSERLLSLPPVSHVRADDGLSGGRGEELGGGVLLVAVSFIGRVLEGSGWSACACVCVCVCVYVCVCVCV